jgi:hypothetical protein
VEVEVEAADGDQDKNTIAKQNAKSIGDTTV